MSELRIILLLVGIGIIVAVYAWTRFKQHQQHPSAGRPASRRTVPRPSQGDEPDADEIEQELSRMGRLLARDAEPDIAEAGADELAADEWAVETSAAEASAAMASGGEAESAAPEPRSSAQTGDAPGLVVVSVVAEPGHAFAGEAVAAAFQHNRLKPGEQSIYHRKVFRDGREQWVFSVANLVKPGTFPAQDMDQFSTPGLTLFLQLPAPIADLEAFDDFVNTAERLAVELGGELRDGRQQLLSHQQLMQVRDSIAGGPPASISRPA